MKLEEMKIVIICMSALMAILIFCMIVLIAYRYRPQTITKLYDRFHTRLKENNSGLFDYNRIESFLIKTGANYHLGNWIEPIKYVAIKLILAVLGIFVGAQVHIIVAFALGVLFYKFPDILLTYLNEQDNMKILSQLRLVYNTLAVQIRAGVSLTDAVAECYSGVDHCKRLYDAFVVLSSDIIVNANMEMALKKFGYKFNNRYIDSLCVILQQALESGQIVDLLSDMTEQIKDIEAAALIRKKSALDRSLTLYELGIMVSVMGVVIYACLNYMYTMVLGF